MSRPCNLVRELFRAHRSQTSLVVLKPGHTYVGYWTTMTAWRAFWDQVQRDPIRLLEVPGRNWIITAEGELRGLVDDGDVVLLEATKVTDRSATFDDALTLGRANLDPGEGFDVAIDVIASRGSVQPV